MQTETINEINRLNYNLQEEKGTKGYSDILDFISENPVLSMNSERISKTRYLHERFEVI